MSVCKYIRKDGICGLHSEQFYIEPCHKGPCTDYVARTNADKIRQMSDEELADFVGGIFTLDRDVCGYYDPRTVVMQEPRVEVRNKAEMLDWLQQKEEDIGDE